MKYTQYGATGATVSVIGFGGMRFDMARSRRENAELVLYAREKGINYFDTAPYYCGDQSESIMGLAFKDMKGEFYCSTKVMPTPKMTAQRAYDSIMRSRERMRVQRIDFMHLWCLISHDDYERAARPGGTLDGILRAQQDGAIKHIVFSSHQPGDGIARVLATGRFRGVLMGMNLLNFPYRMSGAVAAREHGCGVVIMNPLAGGQIPLYADRLKGLALVGEEPAETALKFLLGCGLVTTALVGFTTKEHVDFACRVADRAEPLTQAQLERIASNVTETMNSCCTGCGYCLNCPGRINPALYMLFYNRKHAFGESIENLVKELPIELSEGTLSASIGRAGDCTKCGACEKSCTQRLPIISRLEEIDSWIKASKAK